jgi:AcrR family transcriptional regulator
MAGPGCFYFERLLYIIGPHHGDRDLPRIVDHDRYRAEIASRAFDLVARDFSLSMREIAHGLGVSTGTLYHYFASKEALMEAVVRAVVDRDTTELERRVDPAHTPAQRLDALLGYLAMEEERLTAEMLFLLDAHRTHGARAREIAATASRRYVQAMEALLPEGGPETAEILVYALHGLLLQRFLTGERCPLLEQTAGIRALLLSRIKAVGP